MSKVTFKYKGTMIKTTNRLSESFEYDGSVATVQDALQALDRRYNNDLSRFFCGEASVILERDGSPGSLIKPDAMTDEKLGNTNIITFFYPFKGG
jgi:hypothetical protein